MFLFFFFFFVDHVSGFGFLHQFLFLPLVVVSATYPSRLSFVVTYFVRFLQSFGLQPSLGGEKKQKIIQPPRLSLILSSLN